MMGISYEMKGVKETLDLFEKLAEEIGDKKATSKFLRPAVKLALQPVLNTARARVPRDKGLLGSTLHIEVRKPTAKDRHSIYISGKDRIIGLVGTRPTTKKMKKNFEATHAGLISDVKNAAYGSEFRKIAKQKLHKAKRDFYANEKIPYDARAIAMEFGTKNVAAKPFLRIAMEANNRNVISIFQAALIDNILKYRSKQ